MYVVLVIFFSHGEKARRNFRQLERVVRAQAIGLIKNKESHCHSSDKIPILAVALPVLLY